MALLTAHRSCIRLEALGWSRTPPWSVTPSHHKLVTLKRGPEAPVGSIRRSLLKSGRLRLGAGRSRLFTPGFSPRLRPLRSRTQAPGAGFEVDTPHSLIGLIWLWRSEAPLSHPQTSPRVLCFP